MVPSAFHYLLNHYSNEITQVMLVAIFQVSTVSIKILQDSDHYCLFSCFYIYRYFSPFRCDFDRRTPTTLSLFCRSIHFWAYLIFENLFLSFYIPMHIRVALMLIRFLFCARPLAGALISVTFTGFTGFIGVSLIEPEHQFALSTMC